MSRAELIAMARRDLEFGRRGALDQVESVYRVPVENYFDRERWQAEMKQIFRRLPLVLATTAEVREPGAYKAIDAAGMQVLITRTRSSEVKAYVNMCSHRGAKLVPEGQGSASRFTCPYHAWTYSPEGELVAVYAEDDFGDIDKSCHGLTELPSLERAGLIWVTLDPNSQLDITEFLVGYDALLDQFGFRDWHHVHTQTVAGPNWKVAYDGYLDYYHLPILHRETFGADMGNRAHYYSWGPHTHLGRPDLAFAEFDTQPDEEWPLQNLLNGVWTIFPHVSIASFTGGGRSVMISQLFPGDSPETSYTHQTFLMENEPAGDTQRAEAQQQFEFLKYVVQEEDYATGIALQKNLSSGAKSHALFGRNEGGGQAFHRWVDRIIAASDDELPSLFTEPQSAGS